MNWNVVAIRLKDGYLAQVWDENDNIWWESKRVYKTTGKAEKAGWAKVNSSMKKFFSDE